jgi:hypothetical protein
MIGGGNLPLVRVTGQVEQDLQKQIRTSLQRLEPDGDVTSVTSRHTR